MHPFLSCCRDTKEYDVTLKVRKGFWMSYLDQVPVYLYRLRGTCYKLQVSCTFCVIRRFDASVDDSILSSFPYGDDGCFYACKNLNLHVRVSLNDYM